MNDRRSLRFGVALAMSLAALALTASGCSVAQAAKAEKEEQRSPFILQPAEREKAVRLAAEARKELQPEIEIEVRGAKVTEEIVTAVALFPATDETDTRRLAAVTSFDYRTGTAARVVVDLGADRVVEARSLPGSSAPAAPQEVQRAKELLAEDSAEYRALFEAPAERWDLATFISIGDDEELAGHRILLVRPVYFQPAPDAPIALVDLTADRILRYED